MTNSSQPLREQDVDADPVAQFQAWFEQATAAGIEMPAAAAVATATPDGVPSVRMVLVKQVDERGFVFFTNYDSRKAGELAANPNAAMLFYWKELGRQVRIEGRVQRTAAEESADYIRSRARASRLSALASPQSRPLDGRATLERRVAELDARYADAELPIPADWGGFRLAPAAIEFWQNRDSRLHDRLVYTPAPGAGWKIQRLAP